MAKNEPSLHQKSSGPSTAKGTRRRPKHFLEQKEALELAASIASVQEGKARSRADQHRQPQPGNPRPDHKTSSSKERIKEKKAVLVAQRARLKKAKAKQRKAHPSDDQDLASPTTRNPNRKRVSFA